jgi:isoaspartyl peptidase/L-asparaginase-like protein (Ntn-hydrolase superfamily)
MVTESGIMNIDRRGFATTLAAASATLSLAGTASAQSDARKPLFVATWNFGLPACKRSLEVLQQTGSLLDAIEKGIHVAEADPNVDSVGLGGAPNAVGVVQLDACFMNGADHRAGAVAGLENFVHPISVARRVMEKTKHVMLVGAGAAAFAREQGFSETNLLTDTQRKKWQDWLATNKNPNVAPPNHDTIALVGLDAQGNLAGGCSTSGLAYKLPGRVGDSPILGSGLYVDGNVGAAGATGIGENVMRYCGSFLIVEFMRSGMDPTTACKAAIERIAKHERRAPSELHINFLAIDKMGRWGGAGTDQEFEVAVVTPQSAELRKPERV